MTARRHAFVAMPFGTKRDADGVLINFDKVYFDYLQPALEAAGLEVFRADQEQRAGDIRTDMFQELLVADLVVADLTLDNPNVWYELGVRHALRARGVVLVCGGRVTTAFDLYTDRKLRYTLLDGAPDPCTLPDDIQALSEMVKATMDSWHGRKISPVYELLPNLMEPDWKSLRIGAVAQFWDQHKTWEQRLKLAGQAGQIGDMLVLAEEAPIAAFRTEAAISAGVALRKTGSIALALEQLERGLAAQPDNLQALQEKGICLQRLAAAGAAGHSLERARAHYRLILDRHPRDAETWALLGRVDKDAWTALWNIADFDDARRREEAAYEHVLLAKAIDSYVHGYRADTRHYYAGINALSLMLVYQHLKGSERYQTVITTMAGAVRFAADCEQDPHALFWSQATLGDLEVLTGSPATVRDAYQAAIALDDKNGFALNSCRAQLLLMHALNFRPDAVSAGLAVFDRALARTKPRHPWQARHVLLFSGHRIDEPNRPQPRFPPDKELPAMQRINAALAEIDAGPDDLALCQAAAGGDLLFLEAALARGVRCRVLLPFDEAQFIAESILPASDGARWRARYFALKDKLEGLRIMPLELGPLPAGVDAYERCNLWLLNSALAMGPDKVRFTCLWDEGGGDGPGGTAHMVEEVQRRTGRVHWIDTRTL